jgi:excisionase family DNA binding protein
MLLSASSEHGKRGLAAMGKASIKALTSAHVWHTRREVADIIGVSTRTVDRIIAAGRLAFVRVGGGVRIPAEELDRYLLSQYRQPALPMEYPHPRRADTADNES